MNWLILTLISAVTLSLSRILQKVLLRNNETDTFAFSFIFPVLVSIIILGYTLITGTLEFPSLLPVWFNVVLMTIFYSAGSVLIYKAYKASPASEVSIIFASSSAWAVVAAIVFLGEKLAPVNIMGILSIILGIVVINYQKSSWKLEKGHLYALISACMFGVAFTNDILIIRYYSSAPPYIFMAFIVPALAILSYRPQLLAKTKYFFSAQILPKLLLTCVIYALSALTLYAAYQEGGNASAIIPIQQTNIVMTVVLSYFFLSEKDKLAQKILGSLFVFLGAWLLI
jgi:bacterial/archaeal transporter family protein